MQESQYKSWIDKFGVTAPIKNLMNCVDSLEDNYEQRLKAMQAEYQADVDQVIECYKQEKQQFLELNNEQSEKLASLEARLSELEQAYATKQIEHTATKDALDAAQKEIQALSDGLKSEQELIALAEKRIKTAEERLGTKAVVQKTAKSGNLFSRIFEVRPKKDKTSAIDEEAAN